MKNLLATTALVLALGIPAAGFAQTATPVETAPAVEPVAGVVATTGFLEMRGVSDLLASDLMGQDVYARRTTADMPMEGAETTTMTAADLETMDNVGQVNDLVLSPDGSVLALVIGVGGFIGVGEQDVAVTMDQVSFAANADSAGDMYIVVNTTGDLLKSSPAFNRARASDASMTTGATTDTATTAGTTNRQMLTAPAMQREGYAQVAAADISIETLIGKSVYGADDSDVGTVDDVIVDDSGAIREVIIDFGGFLGMGATQVALTFEELSILTNVENTDIRVYVDATKEQVEAMPVYTPAN